MLNRQPLQKLLMSMAHNYYQQVVKRRMNMMRDPHILAFAKKKHLNKKQIRRMVDALIAGRSWFDEKV